MFLPHPRVKVSNVGSLRDREVACLASDRQGSNFEFCVGRTVSSQSSHHPQEVILAQLSLYVHRGGLKPDSFHCISSSSMSHCNVFLPRTLRWHFMAGQSHCWPGTYSILGRYSRLYVTQYVIISSSHASRPTSMFIIIAGHHLTDCRLVPI